MPSGLTSAGVDLDSLFAARSSAKIADVGFRVAGVDISNRYEPRGGTTAIANTGFAAAGTDLAQLFMGAGSVSLPSSISRTMNGVSGGVRVRFTIGSNLSNGSTSGSHYMIDFAPGGGEAPAPTYGTWGTRAFTATSPYDLQYVHTSGSGPSFSDAGLSGNGWVALSASPLYIQTQIAAAFIGTINIRRRTDLAVVASSTLSLTALFP